MEFLDSIQRQHKAQSDYKGRPGDYASHTTEESGIAWQKEEMMMIDTMFCY